MDESRQRNLVRRLHLHRALMAIGALGLMACGAGNARRVTVYVSEDQVFSEPILKDFERETGINVRAVYDTEEAKSTGVMNRLIAEKDHPQADVYWANEPVRAEALKKSGITAPYSSPSAAGIPAEFRDGDGHWTGFSARGRVMIVNKNARLSTKPGSVLLYVDPRAKGRGVIANPLFGTTTAYVAAIFTQLGDEKGKAFLEGLKRNDVRVSTSNGETADMVASGEFDFGLVDTDDAVSRIRQGRPVEMVFPDQGPSDVGMLILPNAAALIRNSPHPDQGRRLVDYLLSEETERKLAFADCAQIPLHAGVATPAELRSADAIKPMKVDYQKVATKMQEVLPILRAWAGQ
jgi:iron(III) transport system substrate-binding protein